MLAVAPAAVRDPRHRHRRRRRRATASRRSAPTRRRGSPATSSRIDLGAVRARLRVGALGPPRGGAARLAEPPARAARGAPAGRAVGRRRPAARSWSTASARCSRPTSATSRTTTCRASSGPDGSSAQVLAMLGRIDAVFAPLGARIETLALSSRGSWRATLDSRRRARARPRQRRRSGRRARRASSRTLRQVTDALPAPARVRRPAPPATATRCA